MNRKPLRRRLSPGQRLLERRRGLPHAGIVEAPADNLQSHRQTLAGKPAGHGGVAGSMPC